jgi:hypothetical protein
MRKKTLVAVLLAGGLLASAGGVMVWQAWPDPYRTAYNAIRFGQPDDELPNLARRRSEPNDERREYASITWDGLVNKEHRHSYLDLNSGKGPRDDPTIAASRWVRLSWDADTEEVEDGRSIFRARDSGRVVATMRYWVGEQASLIAIFEEGRAVEKVYLRYRSGPGWWERWRTKMGC